MNLKILNFLFSLFLILPCNICFAGYADINYFTYSDKFETSTSNNYTKSLYDFTIGFEATNNKQIVLGINSGSVKITDIVNNNESSFVTTDVGLKILLFFSKSRNWSSSIIYYFTSTAKYNDGTGTEVSLRGSAVKFDFGYNFWLNDYFSIGTKIYYYAPTFKESVSNNVITDINYKRTILYPNFSINYSF